MGRHGAHFLRVLLAWRVASRRGRRTIGIHGRGILGSRIEGEEIMKLSNLFMIALLAGTLGVFGCSDDPPSNGNGGTGGDGNGGSGGDGGTGGGAADPCTGGFCNDPSEAKTACEVAVDYCKGPDCCSGAGGAGGGVDPTDEQCDGFGEALCTIDFGGTGGAGGGTGGAGGGGSDGPTAEEVCDECDSPDVDRIAACEKAYDDCIAADPLANVAEKCAIFALSRCGI